MTSSTDAARDWKKLGGPFSVVQTETVSPEDPVPFPSLPRPSPVSLDATLSPFRVSGSTDLNMTGLSTPRPSLELPETTRPLAFDDVVSMLKPLLEGTAGIIRELSIDGVTLDTVEELQTRSRASKLPGWERLRCES